MELGIRFGVPALVAAVGPAVVITSSVIRTPAGLLWSLLAIALTVAAAAVHYAGTTWWGELQSVIPVTARKIAPVVVSLTAGGVSLTWMPSVLMAEVSWRGAALVSAAIVGAVPAGFVLLGIHAGLGSRTPDANAAILDELMTLRSLAQRQLGALGALVALATLALGASLRAAGDAAGPPESIFVFGAACSVAVALLYLPARTALTRSSERLVDTMFPLTGEIESSALLETAEKRRALRSVLGLDGDLVADLHANVAILAPLMAGAIDLLL